MQQETQPQAATGDGIGPKQGIVKGDVLQRLAGISLVVGGVLTGVGGALYPRLSGDLDIGNPQPVLQAYADAGTGRSLVAFLMIAVGVWGFVIGWLGIRRSVEASKADPWTRLGFYGVLVSAALFTTLLGADMAIALVADQWAGAAEPMKSTWLAAGAGLTVFNLQLFALSVVALWLALAFTSIGLVQTDVYPKWSGWSLLVLGAVGALLGLVMVFSGPVSLTLNIVFPVVSTLTSLWVLVVGARTITKAW